MCTSRLFHELLDHEIQHTFCLSPAGYSTVLQDTVPMDPVSLELHLALTCNVWTQALPLIPYDSQVGVTVVSTT